MYFFRLDYSSIYKIHLGALMLIMMLILRMFKVDLNSLLLLEFFNSNPRIPRFFGSSRGSSSDLYTSKSRCGFHLNFCSTIIIIRVFISFFSLIYGGLSDKLSPKFSFRYFFDFLYLLLLSLSLSLSRCFDNSILFSRFFIFTIPCQLFLLIATILHVQFSVLFK